MRYRCEFEVDADLVLTDESPVATKTVDGTEIRLVNGPKDEDGHHTYLIASVIGCGDDIKTADIELRARLAEHLDLLAFCTHSAFAIRCLVRTVEWEEGSGERRFRAFNQWKMRHPPEPDLVPEHVTSAQMLDEAEPPPFLRTALKYFRYGLLEDQPEDQFMRFWLALEVVAENTKNRERVPIGCPTCGSSLSCSDCGTQPTRVPMAKQAIEHIVRTVTGSDAQAALKRLFITRNGLMHGRSVESIEREADRSIADLVDEVGAITWHAIMSPMPAAKSAAELVFGHRDGQFVNKHMRVAVDGSFRHEGPEPHPAENMIPSIDIKKMVRFGPLEPLTANTPDGD